MPVIYCVKQANLTKNKSTSKCALLDWVFNDELNSSLLSSYWVSNLKLRSFFQTVLILDLLKAKPTPELNVNTGFRVFHQ